MKKKQILLVNAWAMLCLLCLLVSCKDDPAPSLPTLNFTQSSLSVNEGDGTVQISLTASEALNTAPQLSLQAAGTAIEGTDYTLDPNFSFTAGATQISLALQLIDDGFISAATPRTIILTLSNASQGVSIGTQNTLTISIAENDSPTSTNITEGFALDLTWRSGTQAPNFILNNTNVDLQMYYYGADGSNVGRSNSIDASETNGFQFLESGAGLADGVYGLWAFYRTRNTSFVLDLELSLALTLAASPSTYQLFTGNFNSADANNNASPISENSYRELLRIRKTGTNYEVVPF